MEKISKNVEELLMRFQIQNQQLENLIVQKQNLIAKKTELDNAYKELNNTSDQEVYKIAGPIIIKSDKEKLKTGLEQEREETELKLKMLEKNEKKLRESIEKSREELQQILPTLEKEE
ncbi:MAG: prefoldin subunit [Candidatus Aenigmatarchaeota archaeon]